MFERRTKNTRNMETPHLSKGVFLLTHCVPSDPHPVQQAGGLARTRPAKQEYALWPAVVDDLPFVCRGLHWEVHVIRRDSL